MHLQRGLFRFKEDTIDAVPDSAGFFLGLDVNVTGPLAYGIADEKIDELDDR